MGYLLLQYFDHSGRQTNQRLFVVTEPVQLDIAPGGILSLRTAEDFCKCCQGHKARRYYFAQDEIVVTLCPVCNGGDEKKWHEVEQDWLGFSTGSR